MLGSDVGAFGLRVSVSRTVNMRDGRDEEDDRRRKMVSINLQFANLALRRTLVEGIR